MKVYIFRDMCFVTCVQPEEELKMLGLAQEYEAFMVNVPDTLVSEYNAARDSYVRIMQLLEEYNAKK